mgnify:CR=1 FL=1
MNLIKGLNLLLILTLASLWFACEGQPVDYGSLFESTTSRVNTPQTFTPRIDRSESQVHQTPHLVDAYGRYVHIKGLNISGSHKAPPSEVHLAITNPLPNTPKDERSRPSRYPLVDLNREDCLQDFPIPEDCLQKGPNGRPCTETDTCEIEYIGSPFPLDEAEHWFSQMASLGFNSVRLITNWESIQPYRPGSEICKSDERYTDECYDLEYLEYYEKVIAEAQKYGIYVLVDMHQDIFSRHIMTYYNESPSYEINGQVIETEPGSLERTILSLFPPYTDWVRGHGAPRWVVQTALPEKRMDSEYWGMFRGLGRLTKDDGSVNFELLGNIRSLLDQLNPGGELPEWLNTLLSLRPSRRFAVNETSDILPLTPWVMPGLLSLDVDRSFAALFAGDEAFPNLVVDDDGLTKRKEEATNSNAPNLKEYLQGHYVGAYLELAKRAKKYDHVIGYDIINEPVGVFLMMTLGGLFKQLVPPPPECNTPIDCVLPSDCRPDSEDWPNCVSLEEGEDIDQALARLNTEANTRFACLDDRGRNEELVEADAVRWCYNLNDTLPNHPLVDEGGEFEQMVSDVLGIEMGNQVYGVIRGLQLLPSDAHPYTLYLWGLSDIDTLAALSMNFQFDSKYLQRFYEVVGQAVEAEDPNAIIWFEPSTSIRMLTGPTRFWDQPLTKPQGIKQLVFAPHWYPDIYPTLGINSLPREFNEDEWLYRDFVEPLREVMNEGPTWLGNIPVVFGEFGTYFNLRTSEEEANPERSEDMGAHLLNSYYEAFEELGLGNMLWCFSKSNSAKYGEDWNHEDFSIIDPEGQPRAWPAYVRTYARATSGKVIYQRFVSQYEYWEPVAGEPRPSAYYDLHMERRESDHPTEIFVPSRYYPNGFYVTVTDGQAFYDVEHQMLYWYPSDDGPGVTHGLHIEPWLDDREAPIWSYFFKGDQVLIGRTDPLLSMPKARH